MTSVLSHYAQQPGSLEWRQQTCSYCVIHFKTQPEFKAHWKMCPIRIRAGHIDPKPGEPYYNQVQDLKRKWLSEKVELCIREARVLGLNTEEGKLCTLFNELRSTIVKPTDTKYRDK